MAGHQRRLPAPVLVNNRFEGNAPLTVQGFVEMLRVWMCFFSVWKGSARQRKREANNPPVGLALRAHRRYSDGMKVLLLVLSLFTMLGTLGGCQKYYNINPPCGGCPQHLTKADLFGPDRQKHFDNLHEKVYQQEHRTAAAMPVRQ